MTYPVSFAGKRQDCPPFHRTLAGYLHAMSISTTPIDGIMFLIEQHNEVNDMFGQLEQMDGATDEPSRQ